MKLLPPPTPKRFLTLGLTLAAVTTAAFLPHASAQSAPKKLTSVGVTVGDLGNPFFVQIGKGAESKAKELGGADVKATTVSGAYDLNQQVNQMENFVSSGVQLIILGAADSKGIAPAVKRAKQSGATVIAVDVGADGGVDATVTSNNVQAGEQGAQYIVDRLKGQGNVIIINGPPVTSVQDRVAGALSVFKKAPGIKILSQDQNAGGSRDGGLRVMTDLLSANPKIDAVFAINDPTGIGADLAAKQARRSEFFIVGVDGAPDAEVALKDKNSLFVATASQDPYAMAAKSVEVGYNIMQGKKPDQPTVLVPTKLITRDNIGEYKGWTSK